MAVDALILGGNGQDGVLLSQALLGKGRNVLAVGRQAEGRLATSQRFGYRQLDLRDVEALRRLLARTMPAQIFHVAAVHASASISNQSGYERVFGSMLDVNVKSVHTVLEHLREENPEGTLLYASSSKVFGNPLPDVISESSPRRTTCLYSNTKNSAGELIDYYRSHHGVLAGVAFLFNHESELRPSGFFIPKLAAALDHGNRKTGIVTAFETLDFYCDWGSAAEYADLMVELLEKGPAMDVVIASGRCVYARDLVKDRFRIRGLSMADHIQERGDADRRLARPYQVDLSKLRDLVGCVPQRRIEDVLEDIVARRCSGRARTG